MGNQANRRKNIIEYKQLHPELSLDEIGSVFEISRQRVWQILRKGENSMIFTRKVNEEEALKIYQQGASAMDFAMHFKVTPQTAYEWRRKFIKDGKLVIKQSNKGRPIKLHYKPMSRGKLDKNGDDNGHEAPDYEEIEKWFLRVMQLASKARENENKFAMLVGQVQKFQRDLQLKDEEISELKKKLYARQEYTNMVSRGEIEPLS